MKYDKRFTLRPVGILTRLLHGEAIDYYHVFEYNCFGYPAYVYRDSGSSMSGIGFIEWCQAWMHAEFLTRQSDAVTPLYIKATIRQRTKHQIIQIWFADNYSGHITQYEVM